MLSMLSLPPRGPGSEAPYSKLSWCCCYSFQGPSPIILIRENEQKPSKGKLQAPGFDSDATPWQPFAGNTATIIRERNPVNYLFLTLANGEGERQWTMD